MTLVRADRTEKIGTGKGGGLALFVNDRDIGVVNESLDISGKPPVESQSQVPVFCPPQHSFNAPVNVLNVSF